MSQAKNLAKMAQSVTSTGTLASAAIQGGGGGGSSASPKITSIGYPGDDTAANIAGGDTIVLTGANFVTGAQVVINGAQASVVTVNSSTQITFTAPANPTGSYILYVVNPDGGTTILVPGIQYSGVPSWTTAAGTLGTYAKQAAFNLTVAAAGDAPVSYSVYSGTLPSGLSLNSSTGAITGTTPDISSTTSYNFVIRATDAQNQDTDRSFSLTIQPSVYNFTSPITLSSTVPQSGTNVSSCASPPSAASIFNFFNITSQPDLYAAATAGTYVAMPGGDDGYIYFTVPISGTWRISAQGGGGGNAGSAKNYTKGARVGGDFVLSGGDVLWISIGHGGGQGNAATDDKESAGGGGATVVAKASTTSKTFTAANMVCLLMAAGGYGQPEARHGFFAPATSAAQGTGGQGFTAWTNKAFGGNGSTYGGMTVWGGWGGGNSMDDSHGPAGGYDGLNTQSANSFINAGLIVSGSEVRENTGTLTTGAYNNGIVTLTKL